MHYVCLFLFMKPFLYSTPFPCNIFSWCLWNWIRKTAFKMELQGQAGKLSCWTTPCSLHSPKEDDHTLLLSGRKKEFLFARQQPGQWETLTTQPMRSHDTSTSQFPPTDSLFRTDPPNSYVSSVKDCSSPLFSGLACGFVVVCISWIAVLCYS